MNDNIFEGKLVRLVMADYTEMARCFHTWRKDSEYMRLLDMWPATPFSAKKIEEWVKKDLEESRPNSVFFLIREKAENRLIGEIGLDGIRWNHGDTFVGIGIGERELWGKGYGTDAMRVMLRYAFTELNLHRVSLDVFEYNPRGIRSYEKAGFKVEGCHRGALNRDGRRWNEYFMGILRSEWEQSQGGETWLQ